MAGVESEGSALLQARAGCGVQVGQDPGVRPPEDTNIQALVEAGPPVVTIFGKSWDLHVTHALGTTLEENLAMIGDSVAYLLKHFEEVIYDAEHFFDGFKKN